jgi:hypothetical protein
MSSRGISKSVRMCLQCFLGLMFDRASSEESATARTHGPALDGVAITLEVEPWRLDMLRLCQHVRQEGG